MTTLGVVGAGGIAARRMLPALAQLPDVRLLTVMDVPPQLYTNIFVLTITATSA